MNDTKRNQPTIAATIVENAEGRVGGLALVFSNGQELSLTGSQLSLEIMERAVWHGLKQKLVDAAAISCNPETGRPATVEDKFAAVKEVYDRLLAGEWNKTRGDGTGTSGGLLFRALCLLHADKSPDAIKAFLAKKSDAEKTALRGNPKVAAIIQQLRDASPKKSGIDTDAMLDELGGDATEGGDE